MKSISYSFDRINAVLGFTLSLVLYTSSINHASAQEQAANNDPLKALSNFYWEYAVLAAHVYDTKGLTDTRLELALGSSWLRREILDTKDPKARERYNRLADAGIAELLENEALEKCGETATATSAGSDSAVRLAENRCKTRDDIQKDQNVQNEQASNEISSFGIGTPKTPADCELSRDHRPIVPINELKVWQQAAELQRSLMARGWRVFVPGLAIDVWRRPRDPIDDAQVVEYVVVYRGTANGGGWISNLRALNSVTPFVWDQYRQVEQATSDIVNQVYQIHAVSDALFHRKSKTRILITTVGHSLGAGLASYVYYKIPQITRAVGFNSSPFDGSSMIRLDQRGEVMTSNGPSPNASINPVSMRGDNSEIAIDSIASRSPHTSNFTRFVDEDARNPKASIFRLHEKGEVLSQVAKCHSGPVWGHEGGPVVSCETVNFARGNWFRQHSMSQLACHLYLNAR